MFKTKIFLLTMIFSLHLSAPSFAMQRTEDMDQKKGITIQGKFYQGQELFNFGAAYFTGQGAPQNYKKAVQFWKLASSCDHASSQFHLGEMYREGRGVPKDEIEARKWLQMAADNGNKLAEKSLNEHFQDDPRALRDEPVDPLMVGPGGFARDSGSFYDTNKYARKDNQDNIEYMRNHSNE